MREHGKGERRDLEGGLSGNAKRFPAGRQDVQVSRMRQQVICQ